MTDTTDINTLIEVWTEAGVLAVDTQVYDLTEVTPFIIEMVEAATESGSPMMQAGLLPARKSLFAMNANSILGSSFGLYAEMREDGVIKCASAAHLNHNDVIRQLREAAVELRKVASNPYHSEEEALCLEQMEKDEWMSERLERNRMLPIFTFRPGQVLGGLGDEGSMMARFVSSACEFLAMPIAAKTPGALPRAARRRLERKGKTVRLTNVTVSRSVTAGLSRPHQPGEHGKALHFVSGHWRISPTSLNAEMVRGQMKIWIEGHWRGDPEYGVVLHRYLARKRNKQQEGVAA